MVSKALVVSFAVHETGVREVIGLDVGEVESGAFWVEFLRSLKQRAPRAPAVRIRLQAPGSSPDVTVVRGLLPPPMFEACWHSFADGCQARTSRST